MKISLYTILFLFTLIIPLKSQWGSEIQLFPNGHYNSQTVSVSTSNNYIHLVCNIQDTIFYKFSSDFGLSWSSEIPIHYYTAINPSISAWGQNVYMVFYKSLSVSSGIYFKYSTNNGLNWSDDLLLTLFDYCIPKIKVYGNNIHLIWDGNFDGKRVIFYKRSTDGGLSWSENIRLTNENFSSNPSIAVEGNNIHLVWTDFRDGHQEVYYKRSTDNGVSWSNDTRLTYDQYHSGSPSISVHNQYVHIVWVDDRNSGSSSDIYYKRSTDNGLNWEEDRRLSFMATALSSPDISVYANFVNVVWADSRINGIMFKRSTDGGTFWDSEFPLTSSGTKPTIANTNHINHVFYNIFDSRYKIYYKRSFEEGNSVGEIVTLVSHNKRGRYPDISSSGSMVHVVWDDNRHTYYSYYTDIYYKSSSDGGNTWSEDRRLTFDSTNVKPVVKSYGNNVCLAYEKFYHAGSDIYFKSSFNNGLNWNSSRVTFDSASSRPTMAVNGNFVHIAYLSSRNNRWDIFYSKSTNYGNSWDNEFLMSNFSFSYNSDPFITSSGSNVHLTWSCSFESSGPSYILYKKSTDNGASWSSQTIIDTGGAPYITSSNNYLFITYSKNLDIYFCRSTDNGLTWSSPLRIVQRAYNPKILTFNSDIYLVFQTTSFPFVGDFIKYTRSTDNGQSWEPIRNVLYDWNKATLIHEFNISNSDGEIHIVWDDDLNNEKSNIVYTKIKKWLPTKVEKIEDLPISTFRLLQNYPNPFNNETKIRFSLVENSNVSLKIYNILGEELETLVNDYLPRGVYEVNWNASRFTSGIYFYQLQTDKIVETKKMILLK